jgi:hypothetical protein
MAEPVNRTRRLLLAAAGIAATATHRANAAALDASGRAGREFGATKQVNVGQLSIGYVEAGPAAGPPVMLLHGWP